MILVSHNTEIMAKLCDRVVWIEQGVSRMQGEAEEVLAAYEASI